MVSRPIGLSRDLENNRAMRADVDQTDVVVWRNSKGRLAAWNNRCPHRGMRLSHGFVRGDRLACLYHGWQYDTAGSCKLIPAHPELDPPTTITTQVYFVIEENGVIWVNTKEPARAEIELNNVLPLRTFTVKAAKETIQKAAAKTKGNREVSNPSSALYQCVIDDRTVSLLCNPASAQVTVVSVLVENGANALDLRQLSRWCEQLRQQAENECEVPA
ncbi:MAG: Rieske (2Fe-2S) protein [Roseobacter sp.]